MAWWGATAEGGPPVHSLSVGRPAAHVDAWLSGAVANRVAAAEAAIARLDAQRTTDLTAFSGLLLRSESVASPKIEHLDVSYRDLSAAMVGARSSKPTAGRVAANVQAMQLAIDRASLGGELTVDDLLAIHRVLMRDDPYEGRWAGTVRKDQNWIGGSDHAPRQALFVPPRPELVPALLEDLVAFINRADLPPIVQAGIAHAQFETIHPFGDGDGNGRTGRVLVHAVLRRRHAAQRVSVPVSTALLAARKATSTGSPRTETATSASGSLGSRTQRQARPSMGRRSRTSSSSCSASGGTRSGLGQAQRSRRCCTPPPASR